MLVQRCSVKSLVVSWVLLSVWAEDMYFMIFWQLHNLLDIIRYSLRAGNHHRVQSHDSVGNGHVMGIP